MNLCIIDDEKPLRSSLRSILLHFRPNAHIQEAGSLEEGINLLKNYKPDLLFLDIELGDGKGFEIFLFIEVDFPVVFVTAHDHYAVKAFKYNAIDYILKPVDPVEIEKALEKGHTSREATQSLLATLKSNDYSKIVLSDSQNVYLVDIKDVMYCQAIGNYTHFHLNENKEIVISKTLKYYDEILQDDGFVRVHQSYLLNINYLDRFNKKDGGEVILKSGTILPVASRKRDVLMEALKSYKG